MRTLWAFFPCHWLIPERECLVPAGIDLLVLLQAGHRFLRYFHSRFLSQLEGNHRGSHRRSLRRWKSKVPFSFEEIDTESRGQNSLSSEQKGRQILLLEDFVGIDFPSKKRATWSTLSSLWLPEDFWRIPSRCGWVKSWLKFISLYLNISSTQSSTGQLSPSRICYPLKFIQPSQDNRNIGHCNISHCWVHPEVLKRVHLNRLVCHRTKRSQTKPIAKFTISKWFRNIRKYRYHGVCFASIDAISLKVH